MSYFAPWVEHRTVNNQCVHCGLTVPMPAVHEDGRAFTHSGKFYNGVDPAQKLPGGTIVACASIPH